MTATYHVWVGTAPADSVVTEWDWHTDDDGYRSRVEYDLIPAESVTPTWEREGTCDTYATALGAAHWFAEYARELHGSNTAVMVTVSDGTGMSFLCTAWNTVEATMQSIAATLNDTIERIEQ